MHARATSPPLRSPWTLAGTGATCRAAATEARLDLAAPAAGLAVGAAGRVDHLVGVDLRAAVAGPLDQWVRGADLTAIYEPDDARRLRATAMWRVWPGGPAAWELVLSAQTALLHADAALAVVSDLDGIDARWMQAAAGAPWTPVGAKGPLPVEAAAVLVRREGSAAIVAVHPQDPRRITVSTAAGRTRVACAIFPTAIEKGVILRSRVLAAVGPADRAESWAGELAGAFASSPPFLDT